MQSIYHYIVPYFLLIWLILRIDYGDDGATHALVYSHLNSFAGSIIIRHVMHHCKAENISYPSMCSLEMYCKT